jgi:hypothetical protein
MPRNFLTALALLLSLAACAPEAPERIEVLGKLEHLDSPAAPGSTEPSLAVGHDGVVYLTWLEVRADSSHVLRFATFQGDSWSRSRAITAGSDWFLSDIDVPSLLVLPGGRMVAHLLRRTGAAGEDGAHGVRLERSEDGGDSWSMVPPQRDSVSAESGFASLFPAGDDSVGVVWVDRPRSDSIRPGAPEARLRYAELTPDSGMTAGVTLDEDVCGQCPTAVAVTRRGPVVAYRDRGAGEVRDVYLARRVDGQWLPGQPVHVDGWRSDTSPAAGPAVAADGDRVVVAWFTAARDTARVLAVFSDDGGATFGRAVRVDGGRPVGRVAVALLDGDRALVSWVERLGADTTEVQARLASRDGSLGNPVLIAEPGVPGAVGLPRMIRSGSDVLFAWTEAGKHPRVQVARIELGESQ